MEGQEDLRQLRCELIFRPENSRSFLGHLDRDLRHELRSHARGLQTHEEEIKHNAQLLLYLQECWAANLPEVDGDSEDGIARQMLASHEESDGGAAGVGEAIQDVDTAGLGGSRFECGREDGQESVGDAEADARPGDGCSSAASLLRFQWAGRS